VGRKQVDLNLTNFVYCQFMLVSDKTKCSTHIIEMSSTVIKDSLLHNCPQHHELLETNV